MLHASKISCKAERTPVEANAFTVIFDGTDHNGPMDGRYVQFIMMFQDRFSNTEKHFQAVNSDFQK